MIRNHESEQMFFYIYTVFSELASLLWTHSTALLTSSISSPQLTLSASAALALGRTHADQLIKNHLVENTNKAVSLWLA